MNQEDVLEQEGVELDLPQIDLSKLSKKEREELQKEVTLIEAEQSEQTGH